MTFPKNRYGAIDISYALLGNFLGLHEDITIEHISSDPKRRMVSMILSAPPTAQVLDIYSGNAEHIRILKRNRFKLVIDLDVKHNVHVDNINELGHEIMRGRW